VSEIQPPQSLRALKDHRLFEVIWPDGVVGRLPFKFLRCECPCAQCVDELTGVRVLKPENIADDVHPVKLEYSGNYALKIVWSDQHSSGIYTWDRLKRLSEQTQ
jgi:DUF971 family protein